MALETEMETIHRELPRLLQDVSTRGKYVLIHGRECNSIWNTVDEALDAGYDRFGLEPFLVKEVTEHERPKYFSRNVARCS